VAISIVVATVSVFVLSSLWYMVLTPVEVRLLGAAAPDRGGRPSPAKATLELLRSAIVAAVIAGIARLGHVHGVGPTVVLGLVLWVGFPLVLLSGSVIWDRVSPVTAALHAGDWLLKIIVISIIVGIWL
jgi:Protein of unknown function (DUF1761)